MTRGDDRLNSPFEDGGQNPNVVAGTYYGNLCLTQGSTTTVNLSGRTSKPVSSYASLEIREASDGGLLHSDSWLIQNFGFGGTFSADVDFSPFITNNEQDVVVAVDWSRGDLVVTYGVASGPGGGTTCDPPDGDDGRANFAPLRPGDVVVHSTDGLLVGDLGRIRQIDASGTITTVAGDGIVGYSGDGGPAAGAELGQVAGMAELSFGERVTFS